MTRWILVRFAGSVRWFTSVLVFLLHISANNSCQRFSCKKRDFLFLQCIYLFTWNEQFNICTSTAAIVAVLYPGGGRCCWLIDPYSGIGHRLFLQVCKTSARLDDYERTGHNNTDCVCVCPVSMCVLRLFCPNCVSSSISSEHLEAISVRCWTGCLLPI